MASVLLVGGAAGMRLGGGFGLHSRVYLQVVLCGFGTCIWVG